MKISKFGRIILSAGLGMLLASNASADSKLAGIELGSDYKTACEKVKKIFAEKEPKSIFRTTNEKCGFEWGNWVGIKTKDGVTVDYIGIKHTTFGFPFIVEAKDIAQAYVKRLDAVSHSLDYDEKYKWYSGTNLMGTEKVTIDYYVTAISRIDITNNASFDLK